MMSSPEDKEMSEEMEERKLSGCWASRDGYRCLEEEGVETSQAYGFFFEHCYEHLGELLALQYLEELRALRSKEPSNE